MHSMKVSIKKLCLPLMAACILFTGCSVQKMVGGKLLETTHDEVIPYMMTQGDLNAACSMGQSMGPVLASMSRFELNPENIGITTDMASGMCAEFIQREQELDRMRSLHEGRTDSAQDALIREKQGHRLAALRMYRAYQDAVSTFGEFTDKCPKFKDDTDEMLSLLGVASGALALLHDFNSEKSVGISLDVPVRIEKAAACFDDKKWWGMPTALRASIWLSIPGSGPEGVDPLEAMQKAARMGDRQGVILARAMLVMMANTVGNKDIMCQALADAPNESKFNHDYDMLNAYAQGLLTHYADVAWTKEKGYRAPFMQAVCPDAGSDAGMDDSKVDDLLDNLLEDEEPAPETSKNDGCSGGSSLDFCIE